MSRDSAHPALHTPPTRQHISPHSNIMGNDPELRKHFVPEGWEDFDRGICPCGEVVVWNASEDEWVADRQMRVLVLTQREAIAVVDMLDLSRDGDVPAALDMVQRQLLLQGEIEEFEAEDD